MQQETLTIYYTSDIHGYVYGNANSTNGLVDCFDQIQKDGHTLVLDGGDNLQGSPLASFLQTKNDPTFLAHQMNHFGVDAYTLGNHDFNYGIAYQRAYIDAMDGRVSCINVLDNDDRPLYPAVIHTMESGLKVGIIGLVTDFVNVWEKPEHLEGIKIINAYEALVNIIDRINSQCDLTIVIYHGGYEADLSSGKILETNGENCGYKIAMNLPVDLLATGHQHMAHGLVNINGTYTFQAAHYGSKLAKISLTIDAPHHISDTSFEWIVPRVDHQVITDPTIKTMDHALNNWLNQPIATLSHKLKPSSYLDMAMHNNGIPVLVNAIMSDCFDCPLSITSMANNTYGLDQHVTLHDLLMVYPYTNTLVLLDMDGATLMELIETNMDYLIATNGTISINPRFEFPKKTHYNYDYYQGISFTLIIDGPKGHRVQNVKVLDQPLDIHDHYQIVTNSYRASGTGGFDCVKKAKIIASDDREFIDIILDYFKKHPYIECGDAKPYIQFMTNNGQTIA